jgi:hypothetical protein
MESQITSILINQGVAVASLMALGWGIWQICNYVAKKVVEPIVGKHLAFVDKAEQCLVEVKDVILEGHRTTNEKLDKIASAISSTHVPMMPKP